MGDSLLFDESRLQENESTFNIDNSKIQSSIQYVVSEVSTLLNCNAGIKLKEQKNIAICELNNTFSINSSKIHKSPQISSSIYLRSNDSLLLSLTALLSNPHHSKYLNIMTENVISSGASQSKIQNQNEINKATENLSKASRNEIVNLIASNLQYYIYEGRVTTLVINDLVFTLMKAFQSERDSKFVFDDFSKWESNNQVFIEARDWSVLISPKECIFLKTCFELRELLTRKGIKLMSYFENDQNYSESLENNVNIEVVGSAIQEVQCSSIDEIDAKYMGRQAAFSKMKAYKHNNIPNYSQFEQIKKYVSSNYPSIKTLFHNPGSSIYIIGNDIITFLQILKECIEENENEGNIIYKEVVEKSKSFHQKNPYWFMKDTKRIVTNFPVRDTKFKASACDCNFIHESTQSNNGCYELNIKGLFLPHSLFVIVNGLKSLCPDIVSCNVSVETIIDPPFIPNEIKKTKHVWEKIIPLLNSIVRSINPSLVEKAIMWRPFLKIDFKEQAIEAEVGKIIRSINDQQIQVLNNNFPVFSLPRKRMVHSTQVQNMQRSVMNNFKNSHVNIGTVCSNYIRTPMSQVNIKQTLNSNIQNSIDSSISGVVDNTQSNSALITGINNQNFGSTSSIENQTNFNTSQPSSLIPANFRTRVHNSLSANLSLLNFRNLGFSNSQNFVSLSTPMGRQILHRIGSVNPIQRLEHINQSFSLIKTKTKYGNSQMITINGSENVTPQNQVKTLDETALCFIGFDSERHEYFTTRAIEEGAKVVTLERIEKELLSCRSKNSSNDNNNFLYSWLQVTRFYCVVNFQCLNEELNEEIKRTIGYQNVLFEAHQFVSLEWFLTVCFEKRALDPDLFTPISRPNLVASQSIQSNINDQKVDNLVIVILESFPHMKKIYNSSKNCQAALSYAIWSNCMQRILKSIYGVNIVGMKDFASCLADNCSIWKNGIPGSVLVIPCNIISYNSSEGIFSCSKTSDKKNPVSALFGSSKGRFNSDIEYIKKKLFEKSTCKTDMGKIDEIIHIITPYWLLESCSMRQKIDFTNFELDFVNTTVRIQKKRKRVKPKTDETTCSVFEQEEACLFFMKNYPLSHEIIKCSSNSIKFNPTLNFVPSHGPWPLWGWKICVLSSSQGELFGRVHIKLNEIGAIVFCYGDNTKDIISCDISEFKEFATVLTREKVNLVICEDGLVSQVSNILENVEIVDEISESMIFRPIRGTKVVGESWVNMVYGTRTLHPLGTKFYFAANKLYDSDGLNSAQVVSKVEYLQLEGCKKKQIHDEKEFNYNRKPLEGGTLTKLDNFGHRRGRTIESKIKEPNVLVNSEEILCTELNDDNKFEHISEVNMQPGIDKLKKRKIVNTEEKNLSKSFETSENKICFEASSCINNYNFKNNDISCNYNGTISESEEFLVPLSFSYFSSIVEDKNKDLATTFVSSHTPIRRISNRNGSCFEGDHFQTPSNWVSPSNHFSKTHINLFSNEDIENETYSQVEVETSNDYRGKCLEISYAVSRADTENVSPILCPAISTSTFIFEC
ncbi:hypothetical protein FG386_001595 [Cryptosporidium ryanae]|uniref:uncharacterized protein n=1 Tax=Cryptosporidium ryanae TaxID=515981 RepID=UPI00351A6F52|nr:hypothetical protein FG386_001595 [Cryptosporidium ryanae]